jgi:hypothetical protein
MSRENLKPKMFSLNDLTISKPKARTLSKIIEKALFAHSLPVKGD